MRFANIIHHVYSQPWFITPEAHASVRAVVGAKLQGDVDPNALFEAFSPEPFEEGIDNKGVLHFPISGVMAPRVAPIERACGVFDTALALETLNREAPNARGVMIRVDSPGGAVMGTVELAEALADLDIPVVGHTAGMQASGAVYATAGADTLFASPSSSVGSIGVYIPWVDRSAQWEAKGLEWDPVVGEKGDLKATGAGPSLDPQHREYLQEQVNMMEDDFRAFVTEHRSDVEDDTMRGQVFTGRQAAVRGLVDFVGSYEDAYDTLLGMID